MASDWPRSLAISAGGRARVGSGRRARLPETPDGPGWKATCTSGCSAIARNTPAVARLNSSDRALSFWLLPLMRASVELPRGEAAGRDVLVEAALVVFSHCAALRLIALVHEGDAKGEADIAKDAGVFRPGDDRARRHDGGDVPVDEAG